MLDKMDPFVKIEFGVNMKGNCCRKTVEKVLGDRDDIKLEKLDPANQRLIVATNQPAESVRQLIETSGLKAVVLGYGQENQSSAVVQFLGPSSVKGVVRFAMERPDECVIDGTIDGLAPGPHGIHIHECGDISRGCDSVGDHYNPLDAPHGDPSSPADRRHLGDLGNIVADESGRATFRLSDKLLKVPDIIGRSMVITAGPDDCGSGEHPRSLIDGNSGDRLACGIIARSSGLFGNTKRLCACDGVSIWDERDRPLAGPGRRA